jgi:hypothetical protein
VVSGIVILLSQRIEPLFYFLLIAYWVGKSKKPAASVAKTSLRRIFDGGIFIAEKHLLCFLEKGNPVPGGKFTQPFQACQAGWKLFPEILCWP